MIIFSSASRLLSRTAATWRNCSSRSRWADVSVTCDPCSPAALPAAMSSQMLSSCDGNELRSEPNSQREGSTGRSNVERDFFHVSCSGRMTGEHFDVPEMGEKTAKTVRQNQECCSIISNFVQKGRPRQVSRRIGWAAECEKGKKVRQGRRSSTRRDQCAKNVSRNTPSVDI